MMLFKRNNLNSRSNVRVRIARLTVAATLLVALIGFGATSPALADHDYRSGPSVEFRAAFPLPLLFPFRVVHTAPYRADHRDRGHHYGFSHDHDRWNDYRGHARFGERKRHGRAAKHVKWNRGHDHNDRRHAHRRH